MSTKYRFSILFLLFFIIPANSSYAKGEKKHYHEWNYRVIEKEEGSSYNNSTEYFVDKDNTDLVIDHKKKEIRLFRNTSGSPIKFINEEHMPIAYSLLTEDGIRQYAFDGTEMVEIGALKIEKENPLAFATKSNSPDITLVYDDVNDEKLGYYGFDGFEMEGIPVLEISGLTDIRTMAFIDENMLSVLSEQSLNIYEIEEGGMSVNMQYKLNNLENPLDMATDGEYLISILNEDKITQFGFSGAGLVEIPALSILIPSIEGVSTPRHITSAEGIITFTDEEKVYTFLRDSNQMHYVEALSITSGLTNPVGVAINKNSKDIIILDEKDNSSIVRYFSFNGSALVEVEELSLELENLIIGGGGKYNSEGVFITNPLEIQKNYVDLIQVGIYAYLEENTSIKLSIYNGYNKEIDKDSDEWIPLWRLAREKGEAEPTLYKNNINVRKEMSDGEFEMEKDDGGVEKLYPSKLNTGLESIDLDIKDYEVVEGKDGNWYLKPKDGEKVKIRDWFKIEIPMELLNLKENSFIRFKMEFTSGDGKKTPKVFVPEGANKINDITDDVAIRLLARKKTIIPIIQDIDPEIPKEEDFPILNPDNIEFPKFPEPIAVDGWVYTTTPTIEWEIPTIDYCDEENAEDEIYQMAYQLVIMAISSEGIYPAYTTDIITDTVKGKGARAFTIPTSEESNIEGPLYASDSYCFIAFIRIWDSEGNESEFSIGKEFNVLAFERPRIEKIESTPNGRMNSTTMIKEGMVSEELLKAKAGTAITFLIDVVGPVENNIDTDEDISIFYYTSVNKEDFLMAKGEKRNLYEMGGARNRIAINAWTPASFAEEVDNSIVKVYLYGDSYFAGRTVFSIPNFAEGIVEINNTVYEDWQVFLEGRN